MNRALAAVVLGFVLVVAACSTPVYTTDRAVHDLETQSQLTHRQATCVVSAIRRHFETEIKAAQKANKGTPLPADQLKLEIDGALATLQKPTSADELATRRAIARCAPDALN